MQLTNPGQPQVDLLVTDTQSFRGQDTTVDNGLAFCGQTRTGSVAAQYSYAQIFNPASSGINCLVDAIGFGFSSSGTVIVAYYDTELATDDGAWINMKSGSSAGQCHIRSGNSASILGTRLLRFEVPSNEQQYFILPRAYLLGENKGLIIAGLTVNISLTGVFFGREV